MQTQEWTCLLGQLVDVQALYELGEVRSHQYIILDAAVEKRDGVPGVAPPDALYAKQSQGYSDVR